MKPNGRDEKKQSTFFYVSTDNPSNHV